MPAAFKWRADRSPILPAPTTSTRRPVRSPKICAARSTAAEAIDAELLATSVSVRTRLASANARGTRALQHRPERAGVERDGVRLLDLPEDLRLADDHRVERRGDAEQVAQRLVAVERVEVRAQARRQCALVDEEAMQRLDGRGVLDTGVELDAIAGRDDHRLADAGHGHQALERSRQQLAGEGDALAHLDGRGLRCDEADDAPARAQLRSRLRCRARSR